MIKNHIKYNALAWDDEPEGYLNELKEKLSFLNILIEIEQEKFEFIKKYKENIWDFIILDLVDKSNPEYPDHDAGIKLALQVRKLNKHIPIVFITEEGGRLMTSETITGPVLYRSKRLLLDSVCYDIIDFLELYYLDYTKVFIIYGQNRKSGNIHNDIIKKLQENGLNYEEIQPATSLSTISQGLIEKMLHCGAFLAICTPDDKVGDSYYQPRQNVLLEIGIAMGMAKGLDRLVILQRWGNQPEFQAKLPSDLDGRLTIRFFDEYQDQLSLIIEALKTVGMKVTTN